MQEGHRSFRATKQKRREIDANAVRADARVRNGVGDGSERYLDRPGPPTWSRDGQLGGQDGPTCRPEPVPSAFPRDLGATQNDPERPETAETSFSFIFHRFWSIFRRFFVDFSYSEVEVRVVLAPIFFRICRAIFTR